MKKIILFLFVLISFKSFSQDENAINVTLVTSNDTTFSRKPQNIVLRFTGLNESYDSVFIHYEINFIRKNLDPANLDETCVINGTLLISLAQYKAAFKNDVITYSMADVILQKLHLKSVH